MGLGKISKKDLCGDTEQLLLLFGIVIAVILESPDDNGRQVERTPQRDVLGVKEGQGLGHGKGNLPPEVDGRFVPLLLLLSSTLMKTPPPPLPTRSAGAFVNLGLDAAKITLEGFIPKARDHKVGPSSKDFYNVLMRRGGKDVTKLIHAMGGDSHFHSKGIPGQRRRPAKDALDRQGIAVARILLITKLNVLEGDPWYKIVGHFFPFTGIFHTCQLSINICMYRDAGGLALNVVAAPPPPWLGRCAGGENADGGRVQRSRCSMGARI